MSSLRLALYPHQEHRHTFLGSLQDEHKVKMYTNAQWQISAQTHVKAPLVGLLLLLLQCRLIEKGFTNSAELVRLPVTVASLTSLLTPFMAAGAGNLNSPRPHLPFHFQSSVRGQCGCETANFTRHKRGARKATKPQPQHRRSYFMDLVQRVCAS